MNTLAKRCPGRASAQAMAARAVYSPAEMVRDGDVGGGDGAAAAGLQIAVWGALLQEAIDVAVILNAL